MPQVSPRFAGKVGDKQITPFSKFGHGAVVEAVFAPLPTLSKPAARPSRFQKPPPTELAVAPSSQPRKISIPRSSKAANSIAGMSPGVMFTDGSAFTGSSRLRLLSSTDPQAKGGVLPKLKAAEPTGGDEAAQDPAATLSVAPTVVTEPAVTTEEDEEEMLVASVGTGSHEQPGEGIHASPSSLAAPKSWGLVKENMMKQLAKSRRLSYTELINVSSPSLKHLWPPPLLPSGIALLLTRVPVLPACLRRRPSARSPSFRLRHAQWALRCHQTRCCRCCPACRGFAASPTPSCASCSRTAPPSTSSAAKTSCARTRMAR